VVVAGVVVLAGVVLFSLNRLSGVPSFFRWAGGGVLFSLKRLSGVPSFFRWVVAGVVVVEAAFVAAGVVWAKPKPAKRNNILAIKRIFFIRIGVFLVKKVEKSSVNLFKCAGWTKNLFPTIPITTTTCILKR
jgi:hypothetical protein